MAKSSSRSRSRSRSRSPCERIDKFGRVIPPRKKLSHSRSRSIERFKKRSRSPHHGRSYRSRSRSHSRSSSLRAKKIDWDGNNKTNIEDPAFLNARIFIGNLPSDRVTKEELENLFQVYGKILGVSIHDRGFGFVQFENEGDARKAQESENGSKLKGQVLDVKMALEGRRGPGWRGGDRGGGRGRGGDFFERDNFDRVGRGRGGDYDRDQGGFNARNIRGAPPIGGRERSQGRGEPFDERYRDPYPVREPPRDSLDRSGLPPHPPANRDDPYRWPGVDDPFRDPYRDDPYRRDPYRRDGFEDPYRDLYRDPYRDHFAPPPPPPKKPLPADVQIICMSKELMQYGESIEAKLQQHAMICELAVIPEGMTVPQMVSEAARLKFLFAAVINSQNETHKSLTLNILHGTPQEHRNMPLEDALKLVATSFEKYIQTQREKAAGTLVAPALGPAAPVVAAATLSPFLPPSSDISYLLNLLADNRQLTIEELNNVIQYLSERRDKLMVAECRRPPIFETTATAVVPVSGTPAVPAGDSASAYLQQQQQQLQDKILNILSGTSVGSSSSTQTPAVPSMQSQVQVQGGYSGVAALPRTQATQGAMNPVINLDNPNVKKALDNLIQSGPNILKNLPSTVTQLTAPRQGPFQPENQQGVNQPRQDAYSQQQQQLQESHPQMTQPGIGRAEYSHFQQQSESKQQVTQPGIGRSDYSHFQQQSESKQQVTQPGIGGAHYSHFQQQSQMQGQAAPSGTYGITQQQQKQQQLVQLQQQRPTMGVRAPQQGVRPRY